MTFDGGEFYRNTGVDPDKALNRGRDIAADTLRYEPQNVARLNRPQFDAVRQMVAVATDPSTTLDSAEAVLRVLGATELIEIHAAHRQVSGDA
jgi:hypothetical protein